MTRLSLTSVIVLPSSCNVIFCPLLPSSFQCFCQIPQLCCVLFHIKRCCLFSPSPSSAFKLCSEMLCFTLVEFDVVLLARVCLSLLSCSCEFVMCFLYLVGPVWFIVLSHTPGYTFFCRFYNACIEYLDNLFTASYQPMVELKANVTSTRTHTVCINTVILVDLIKLSLCSIFKTLHFQDIRWSKCDQYPKFRIFISFKSNFDKKKIRFLMNFLPALFFFHTNLTQVM